MVVISLVMVTVSSREVIIFPDNQDNTTRQKTLGGSVEFPGPSARRGVVVGPKPRLGLYLRTGHHEYRLLGGQLLPRAGGRINFPGHAGRG